MLNTGTLAGQGKYKSEKAKGKNAVLGIYLSYHSPNILWSVPSKLNLAGQDEAALQKSINAGEIQPLQIPSESTLLIPAHSETS